MQPTAEQLAAAPAPPPSLRREYTKVPDSLPPVVAQTAREVTKGARERLRAGGEAPGLVRRQTAASRYDTEVRVRHGRRRRSPASCSRRRASASTSRSRWRRWPGRWAFRPGSRWASRRAPRRPTARCRWACATRTPGRSCTSRAWAGPASSRPRTGASTPDVHPCRRHAVRRSARAPRPARADASTAPSAAPSASESCPPQAGELGDCGERVRGGRGGVRTTTGARWGLRLLGWTLLTVGALLALAIPLLPMLWRLRVRAVRLGSRRAHAGGRRRPRTLAAWQEVTDTAWDHGILPDESQTPRKAAARIVRLGRAGRRRRRTRCTGWRRRWSRCSTRRVPQTRGGPRPDDAHRIGAGLQAHAGPPDAAAGAAAAAFDRPGGLGPLGPLGGRQGRAAGPSPDATAALATPLAGPEHLGAPHRLPRAGFARRRQTCAGGRAVQGPDACRGRTRRDRPCAGGRPRAGNQACAGGGRVRGTGAYRCTDPADGRGARGPGPAFGRVRRATAPWAVTLRPCSAVAVGSAVRRAQWPPCSSRRRCHRSSIRSIIDRRCRV